MTELKKLVCVKYPGNVINPEKAIETLGGLEKLAEVTLRDARSRLELRFRPKDPFCKPAYGDVVEKKGLLVKICKTRAPHGASDSASEPEVTCSWEVMGYVEKIYTFESMCDFQYLPVNTHGGRKPATSFLEKLNLDRWRTAEDFFSLSPDVDSLYLTPNIFSRMDRPLAYNFRDKLTTSLDPDSLANNEEVDAPLRQRTIGSLLFHFTAKEIPNGPSKGALDHFANLPPAMKNSLPVIQKAFEERPVWSKLAIAEETKYPRRTLKSVLPAAAYYFLSGPWRYCWIRFGYDPRKDPEARKLQVVDFRARKAIQNKLKLPRSSLMNFQLPSKRRGEVPEDLTQPKPSEGEMDGKSVVLGQVDRISRVTESGICLTQSQIMYQVCDVDIEAVRTALKAPPQPRCAYDDGFFPSGTMKVIRTAINQHVNKLIARYFGGGDAAGPEAAVVLAAAGVEDDASDEDMDTNEQAEEAAE